MVLKAQLISKSIMPAGFSWSIRWAILSQNNVKFFLNRTFLLSCYELILAVTNDYIVFQIFCNNSQNNLLHNFARHQSEACNYQDLLSFFPWKLGHLPASSQLGPLQIPETAEK